MPVPSPATVRPGCVVPTATVPAVTATVAWTPAVPASGSATESSVGPPAAKVRVVSSSSVTVLDGLVISGASLTGTTSSSRSAGTPAWSPSPSSTEKRIVRAVPGSSLVERNVTVRSTAS